MTDTCLECNFRAYPKENTAGCAVWAGTSRHPFPTVCLHSLCKPGMEQAQLICTVVLLQLPPRWGPFSLSESQGQLGKIRPGQAAREIYSWQRIGDGDEAHKSASGPAKMQSGVGAAEQGKGRDRLTERGVPAAPRSGHRLSRPTAAASSCSVVVLWALVTGWSAVLV